jgi:hypothetical protein
MERVGQRTPSLWQGLGAGEELRPQDETCVDMGARSYGRHKGWGGTRVLYRRVPQAAYRSVARRQRVHASAIGLISLVNGNRRGSVGTHAHSLQHLLSYR